MYLCSHCLFYLLNLSDFKKIILIGGYLQYGGLYNIVMTFAIHQHESAMVYPCLLHPEPPSPVPPHPIPLGCPRALALGTLLHASNLRW